MKRVGSIASLLGFILVLGFSLAACEIQVTQAFHAKTPPPDSPDPSEVQPAADDFFVAPPSEGGSPSNDGSISKPWDLQTALNQPSTVVPGKTIWLRGGTHRLSDRTTKFVSKLLGTSAQPITVRQYPGERAIVDGNIMQLEGGYVNYWGFEILNSQPSRYTSETGPFPQKWWVNYDGKTVDLTVSGLDIRAPNIKLINMIIHDSIGGGIGADIAAENLEIYGTLSYYNGWQASDRAHGHGLYAQNTMPSVKKIKDCMFFENLALGAQATGAGPSAVADNMQFEGNAFFMNGILAYEHQQNFLVGPFQGSAKNPVILRNFIYDTQGASTNSDSYLGYAGGMENAVIKDNYFQTPVQFSSLQSNLILTGNIFLSTTLLLDRAAYPNNMYATSLPTHNLVEVRPNAYESGRAHVIVYNWQHANQVSVDVSGIGLKAGDVYEIHNVQDFYGDVVTRTYQGKPVSLSMTGHSVAKPIGDNFTMPPTTFPEFGAFVIKRKN